MPAAFAPAAILARHVQTALVTGASLGIGCAIAVRLVRAGAEVVALLLPPGASSMSGATVPVAGARTAV